MPKKYFVNSDPKVVKSFVQRNERAKRRQEEKTRREKIVFDDKNKNASVLVEEKNNTDHVINNSDDKMLNVNGLQEDIFEPIEKEDNLIAVNECVNKSENVLDNLLVCKCKANHEERVKEAYNIFTYLKKAVRPLHAYIFQ